MASSVIPPTKPTARHAGKKSEKSLIPLAYCGLACDFSIKATRTRSSEV